MCSVPLFTQAAWRHQSRPALRHMSIVLPYLRHDAWQINLILFMNNYCLGILKSGAIYLRVWCGCSSTIRTSTVTTDYKVTTAHMPIDKMQSDPKQTEVAVLSCLCTLFAKEVLFFVQLLCSKGVATVRELAQEIGKLFYSRCSSWFIPGSNPQPQDYNTVALIAVLYRGPHVFSRE